MNLSTEQKIIRDLILSTDVINDYVENEITFDECINEFQTIKERLDEHYHSKSNIIDGGDYLCVTYRGNYEQSAYWGQQLAQYAHAHKFKIRGDLLEILWIDIHTTSDESEYITQLQLPIA